MKRFFSSEYDEDEIEEEVIAYISIFDLEKNALLILHQVADTFKEGNVICLSLKDITEEDSRRFLDFIFGVVYALDGVVKELDKKVILCVPKGIVVEKEANFRKEISQQSYEEN